MRLKNRVKNLISEKHQITQNSIILTVKNVYKLDGVPQIDFGGSEYKECKIKKIVPIKESKSDSYGWWSLPKGSFLVEFNEVVDIPKNYFALLQPLERSILSDVVHPAQIFSGGRDQIRTVLRLKRKIKIKENARISELVFLKR